jgi:capsular polysaccharide export protein
MGDPGMGLSGGTERQRLFAYNAGFWRSGRVRRILQLAGYDLRLGLPGSQDRVAIWGNSPTAHRGRFVAARRGTPLLTVEDAFLRSIRPGRAGDAPMGLVLDRSGVHFDSSVPSDLEHLLTSAPLDDTALLDRARNAMARLRNSALSKYNSFDPDLPCPDPGYVLVVDQTRDDASLKTTNAGRARFREMLVFAQEEHPGVPVVVKSHPETLAGYRDGHYTNADTSKRVRILTDPVNPWALLDGAVGVYTVSSQLGFEAILAGHRPRVFGQPFYAGWGLTEDEDPVPRRVRRLTRAQLFAAAMILYPTWYDPFRDRLCQLETVIDTLEAQVRAWRQDRRGWAARGINLWKRPSIQSFFGQERKVVFTERPKADTGRRQMVWASKAVDADTAARVEDGFLRSRGLGADLVEPLSLVIDDLGIYYDPTRSSRLEQLIARRATLRADERRRAERLITSITSGGLSKYNTGGALRDLPEGRRVLVVGQVEDDASIKHGADTIRSNTELLKAARVAEPAATLIYKPHPDVEAGLRPGAIPADVADLIASECDPSTLLGQVDAVWTITSLMGFEALLRGVPVTTVGRPFYAGWGLTTDLVEQPARRTARPDLAGLVHAALIDYPRYLDPCTGQICPVEVLVERLLAGHVPCRGTGNRVLSKLQGLFATQAHVWRR